MKAIICGTENESIVKYENEPIVNCENDLIVK